MSAELEMPYKSSNVKLKEKRTYLFDASFGPVQVGIPPETIKVSMKNNETVPSVYILPPAIFADDGTLGEIEFPIFFNFFIKKAIVNPDQKVWIVGDSRDLNRVKVFKLQFYCIILFTFFFSYKRQHLKNPYLVLIEMRCNIVRM